MDTTAQVYQSGEPHTKARLYRSGGVWCSDYA